MRLNGINKVLVLFSIALFTCKNSNIDCRLNESNSLDSNIIHYHSGEIEQVVYYRDSLRNGFSYRFNKKGDTLEHAMYENDSIVYKIEFDSLGEKISDKRTIYWKVLNDLINVRDTITVDYYIVGPRQEYMMLTAAASIVNQKERGYFKNYLSYDTINKINQLVFIPINDGKYKLRFGCFDEELLKIVGYAETYIDVK